MRSENSGTMVIITGSQHRQSPAPYQKKKTIGWLPVGFRNLNNISKPFYCHRPGSRLPNGSHFEVSCHCLSIRPISRFVSRRGIRNPRSVLNLNINAFFPRIFIARHLWILTLKNLEIGIRVCLTFSRFLPLAIITTTGCQWRQGLRAAAFWINPWHLHNNEGH